jgi:hypothetical protein
MKMQPMSEKVKNHPVVPPAEWLAARQDLLKEEKELTRLRDRISAKRRELPWMRVEKDYRFQGPDGVVALADLFDGRSQLIVQHFMFGPDWEEGCVGCSFGAMWIQPAFIFSRGTFPLSPFPGHLGPSWRYLKNAWAGILPGFHHMKATSTTTSESPSSPNRWGRKCFTITARRSLKSMNCPD